MVNEATILFIRNFYVLDHFWDEDRNQELDNFTDAITGYQASTSARHCKDFTNDAQTTA